MTKPCETGAQCLGGKCPECEREWVGLTDDEIREKFSGNVRGDRSLAFKFARAIEAKLKEKNT